MGQTPSPRRSSASVLAVIVLIAAVLVLAPNAIAAWLGGLVGDIWVTALDAITELLSGLLGSS